MSSRSDKYDPEVEQLLPELASFLRLRTDVPSTFSLVFVRFYKHLLVSCSCSCNGSCHCITQKSSRNVGRICSASKWGS